MSCCPLALIVFVNHTKSMMSISEPMFASLRLITASPKAECVSLHLSI